jgi:DNA-binding NarL/FixJ family response regulator
MYFFADEINRIKKGESFDQEMNILMSEREQAIRQLRSQLINSRISKQLNLSGTCVKLESIRMYNLMVI